MPTKFSGLVRSRWCASTISGVPLLGSVPFESSATRGAAIPLTTELYAEPITANDASSSAVTCSVAPTSSISANGSWRGPWRCSVG